MLLAQRVGFVRLAHSLQMNGQGSEVGEGFFVVRALLAAAEIESAAQQRLVVGVAGVGGDHRTGWKVVHPYKQNLSRARSDY
jgi:hypothetical protein